MDSLLSGIDLKDITLQSEDYPLADNPDIPVDYLLDNPD